MTRLLLLALACSTMLSSACTDQVYTPIGDETLDEICEGSDYNLYVDDTVYLSLETSTTSYHSAKFQVNYNYADYEASGEDEVQVVTEGTILPVPNGSEAKIELTNNSDRELRFKMDYRLDGESSWIPVGPTNEFDGLYDASFTSSSVVGTTWSSTCSGVVEEHDDFPLATLDGSSDYQVRVRVFPVRPVEGVHVYELEVTLR